MAVAGLYRRPLPSPPATEFGSPEGKLMFREALQDGTMEGFFQLIAHFQTQAEPAFCGLATLSVVLNALAIDPGRTWKGSWRWIDESMLECCDPLEKVKLEGMSFAKLACAGACAGASVRAIRSNKSSLDEFRQLILAACSSEDNHAIVSYDRRKLQQTGGGHFSPIGGYHRHSDMALILDVARFKYPPHWIPLPLLWEAMHTVDPTTSNWRGYMLVTKPERRPSVLFTLSCKDEEWLPISKYLLDDVPALLASAAIASSREALSVILRSLPGNVSSFVKWIAEVRRAETATAAAAAADGEDSLNAKSKILEELRGTRLYSHMSSLAECACLGRRIAGDGAAEELEECLKRACCQGAAALYPGQLLTSAPLCCAKAGRDKSGTETFLVVGGGGGGAVKKGEGAFENAVDVLVPSSPVCIGDGQCTPLYPVFVDMLTVLMFTLPPESWSNISNPAVAAELFNAASVAALPTGFGIEVSNLREQLNLVRRWCIGETDDNQL